MCRSSFLDITLWCMVETQVESEDWIEYISDFLDDHEQRVAYPQGGQPSNN